MSYDMQITHRNRHAQRRKIKATGSAVFTLDDPASTSFLWIHLVDSDINSRQSRNGTRTVCRCVDAIHHQIHRAHGCRSVLHQ